MKNKRNNKIAILLFILLVISIGYAALNSNLTINGTSTINNASWDVHWNNVRVTNGSVTGDQVTTAAHILTGATEVEYLIAFKTPGEYYEFTVDAVNAGSIDAMIGSFSNKVYDSDGEEERTLPDYLSYTVTYSDGIAVANNHKLAANTTERYKVRVEFKTDINANQLPSSQDRLVYKFNVNYVQANSNAIDVNHQTQNTTVYTANVLDGDWDTIYDGTNTSAVWLGREISQEITTYETPELAMAALKQATGNIDRPFFLKHTIQNNIVTESYLGFVVSNEMAQANPGMTAGTYYLRGLVDEYDTSEKPVNEANKAALLSAFGSSNCTEYSSTVDCSVSDLRVYMYSDGFVSITVNPYYQCLADTEYQLTVCTDEWS